MQSPSITTRPAEAAMSAAARIVGGEPTASKATATPSSSVQSRAASTTSVSPACTVTSAPISRARDRRLPSRSETRHRAPLACAISRSESPMAPAPMMATASPSTMSARSVAWRAIDRGSASIAISSATESGTACTRSHGATNISAMVPGAWTPMTRILEQQLYRPRRHGRHSPQLMVGSRATRRPMGASQFGPTAMTSPTTSWPGISGYLKKGCEPR